MVNLHYLVRKKTIHPIEFRMQWTKKRPKPIQMFVFYSHDQIHTHCPWTLNSIDVSYLLLLENKTIFVPLVQNKQGFFRYKWDIFVWRKSTTKWNVDFQNQTDESDAKLELIYKKGEYFHRFAPIFLTNLILRWVSLDCHSVLRPQIIWNA